MVLKDHSSLKEEIVNSVPKVDDFFNTWLKEEKQELSLSEVKSLISKVFPKQENQDFDYLLSKLVTNNLIKKSKDNHYYPTPLAVSISQYSLVKISRNTALKAVDELLIKINTWNDYAYDNLYPSIAGIIAFGSFVSKKEKIGDIDIAVLFRQNTTTSNSSSLLNNNLNKFKNPPSDIDIASLSYLSKSEIEDRIISWLEVHPINIVGMDDLRAIKSSHKVDTLLLFKDKCLISKNDFGDGVNDYEVNDFFYNLSSPPIINNKYKP